MNKAIVMLVEEKEGKTYRTFHVIPKFLYLRFSREVKDATINAFPTEEEANGFIKTV